MLGAGAPFLSAVVGEKQGQLRSAICKHSLTLTEACSSIHLE